METAAPPNLAGAQEEHKFKNRLQQVAQRASMHLPVYQTFNEGPPHFPKFRSTVIVGGTTVTTPYTFHRLREAEQHVAKFALESIGTKIKQEAMKLIHNETVFCKAILNEYATKMKMEFPAYKTTQLAGLLPSFLSSVVFDGKTYKGGMGRNKKEAEQMGARTVIEWLLGQSGTSTTMAEIIKSKDRFFNAANKGTSLIAREDNIMPLEVAVHNHPGDIVAPAKDVPGPSILPPVNVVPLEEPSAHTGGISSNGEALHIVSTFELLPVPAAEPVVPPAAEPVVPPAAEPVVPPAAEPVVPPAAENPKEECISDVLPGSISGANIVPTIEQNNQPEGLISKHSDRVCIDSCLEQAVQVKTEVTSEDPQTSQFHGATPTSGGKRSHRNKKKSNSKKPRRQ